MTSGTLNGRHLKEAMRLAVEKLAEKRTRLNKINVFPVPDGDTGNNMLSTFESAYQALEGLDTPALHTMAQAAYRGARSGSTGNSGAIFAQYLRGWAQAFDTVETADASHLKEALSLGVKYAYEAVQKPKEGTILTVAREASETHRKGKITTLEATLSATYRQARTSLKNTKNVLPELKDQDVIDAGGWGLLIFFSAVLGALGIPLGYKEYDFTPTVEHFQSKTDFAFEQPYDMEFVVIGEKSIEATLRQALDELGTELIIQSNGTDAHVHIHSADPMRIVEVVAAIGRIDDCIIRNMHSQHLALHGKDSNRLPYATLVLAEHPGFIAMSVLAGAETAMTRKHHRQKRHILQEYASRETLTITTGELDVDTLEDPVVIACEARILAAVVSTYAMDKPSEKAIHEAAGRPRIVEIRRAVESGQLGGEGKDHAPLETALKDAMSSLEPDIGDVLTIYFGRPEDRETIENMATSFQAAHPGLEQVDCFFSGQEACVKVCLE